LCASLAAVAATHPQAWFRDGKSAEEISVDGSESDDRVSLSEVHDVDLDVDQAAALIVTAVEQARALGIRSPSGSTSAAGKRPIFGT
jgi:hypothetical protein